MSVVIPTANRAELVMRSIDSVLAQTYDPLECIVVDDGSTDGTVLRLTQRYGDRICILRNEVSEGVARARNRGIAAARGEYVAFLDSDDEWLPSKIERQIELAERGADLVFCSAANVLPDGTFVGVKPARVHRDIRRALLRDNVVSGSASGVLLRRSCFDVVAPFRPGIYGEDWELWIRLGFHFRFAAVPEVLVRIAVDPCSRHWSTSAEVLEASLRSIYESLAEDPSIRDAVRKHRRICDATVAYFAGGHAAMHGERMKALRYYTRALFRDPLQLRIYYALVVLSMGTPATSAARHVRAWLYARRAKESRS